MKDNELKPGPLTAPIERESLRRLEKLMDLAFPGWEGFRDSRFEEEEVNYKRKASETAQRLLGAERLTRQLHSQNGVDEFISDIKKVAQATNLLYLARPSSGDLALLYNIEEQDKGELCRAVFDLLHGPGESPERLQRFVDWELEHQLQPKWTFPTYFLFLLNPQEDLFVKPHATRTVFKHAGLDLNLPSPPTGPAYGDIVAAGQELIRGMSDLNARDMFDIQSMIWVCNQQLSTSPNRTSDKPVPEKEPPAVNVTFDELLGRLKEKGLYFPAELVSNFLLALQSKRFVLLTGISGTGKTQLALEVANFFRPKVTVRTPRQPTDDAFPLSVQPYMLRHHHIVLPVAFVAEARFPGTTANSNSVDIDVAFPEGQTTLRMWRDPSRNVTTLSLKGEIREWFGRSFREGDVVHLIAGLDTGSPHIELVPAEYEESEELLDNHVLEAVRPDWTDNRGLLGYYNPLTGRYFSTPFLYLLLRAERESREAEAQGRNSRPFFAILDEMNLARVEHYFSDFLSAMESGEAIHLHDVLAIEAGDTPGDEVIPRKIQIPANLFFVGTVNIDESTYMFSPKVLDRAFTLELNDVELNQYSGQKSTAPRTFRASHVPREFVSIGRPDRGDWDRFGRLFGGRARQCVVDLNDVLATENRHFGYRVANEIARFVCLAHDQVGQKEEVIWTALDLALLAKALPKLHGTQQELEPVLDLLFGFAVRGEPIARGDECLTWTWNLEGDDLIGTIPAQGETDSNQQARPRFPQMARKLHRMRRRLRLQGFTSFIE